MAVGEAGFEGGEEGPSEVEIEAAVSLLRREEEARVRAVATPLKLAKVHAVSTVVRERRRRRRPQWSNRRQGIRRHP